jgi:peptidyl-prolyl cis-trans isomerase A (cyclophilin A)
MVRNLVSWFLIVGFAVGFCGFIGGCGEEQAKEQGTEIEVVEPVVEMTEKVVEPVVEVTKKVVEPVVEVTAKVVEPVVEVTAKVVEAVVAVVTPGPVMPTVVLDTSMGEIVIELNPKKAPITVANFLRYVNDGFYDGLIFHRVMPGFMIQAGGFNTELMEQKTRKAIKNECQNGLGNSRGTIAMARGEALNTATSQFFINVGNNTFLNFGGPNGGYAVFGKVVKGLAIVDAIVAVDRVTKISGSNKLMQLQNCPVVPVVIKSAKVVGPDAD